MNKTFHWADYLVFALMLVICAGIGIGFGWLDRKKKSTKNFLLGGGDLSVFPVGVSIIASFTSAVAILGFSAEMYRFGTMYWLILISQVLSQALTALIYIPLFHGLKLTSAYQYLELRFHKSVKVAASIIFCFQMFLYMGVALYTPALAIQRVTGIPLIASIAGTGAICAFYTIVGGMKATVWIDTFQIGILLAGLLLVVIKGSLSIEGGFSEVWQRAVNSDRIEFFDFDPNPLRRHTFWTLVIGGFFTNLTIYGSNQGTIQRYLSVKKWTDASKALAINLVGGIIILTSTCLCGLVAYAKYYDCDPLSTKEIEKNEELLPLLVMDILGELPGLPGLFVASIYSAALSTISAGMNSLAAVCITDFIRPFYKFRKGKDIKENIANITTKLMALGFGVGAIGLAYLCQFLGSTVLQLALSIFGLLGGPLLGVISLGMFNPYANWIGALCGLLLSTVLNLWVGVGGVIYGKPTGLKPVTTIGCTNYTTTMAPLTTSGINVQVEDEGLDFYKLSYLYYSFYAMIVVTFVGTIVSLIIDKFNLIEKKPLDSNFYISFAWITRLFSKNKIDPNLEKAKHQLTVNGSDENKISKEKIKEKEIELKSLNPDEII